MKRRLSSVPARQRTNIHVFDFTLSSYIYPNLPSSPPSPPPRTASPYTHAFLEYHVSATAPPPFVRHRTHAYTHHPTTHLSRGCYRRCMHLPTFFSPRSNPDLLFKVGIATQLPSGTHSQDNLDYNSYWSFLLNQHDAYESFPAERLDGISCVSAVSVRLLTVLFFTPFMTGSHHKPVAHS